MFWILESILASCAVVVESCDGSVSGGKNADCGGSHSRCGQISANRERFGGLVAGLIPCLRSINVVMIRRLVELDLNVCCTEPDVFES